MKIIGILNYNSNSFSDGGRYNDIDSAYNRLNELFEEGADIVDVGVCATSYQASKISEFEELNKIKPLLEKVSSTNISIDSYHYNTIKYAISKGVKYVNDVTGGKDPRLLELIASSSNLYYICMYSLVLPADKNIRVKSVNQIYEWVENKIKECKKFGIHEERIIIDPGLGFTTDAMQSIEILKNIKKLKEFGVKICIGHSRKSFLKHCSSYASYNSDIDTLVASLYLLLNNIDYIRVHNVKVHKRSCSIFSNLMNQAN